MHSLIKYRQNGEIEGPGTHVLWPLRKGMPVVLSVSDKDMYTITRVPKPRLVITPLPSGELCFSLEGHGCEIAMPDKIQTERLWRMGLTVKSARALISEILSTMFD